MTTGTPLMRSEDFIELLSIRERMIGNQVQHDVAGVFVPWAGDQLQGAGGIYYVGIATDGAFGRDDPQTLSACSDRSASVCQDIRDLSHTPFWRYLDQLSSRLLGGSCDKTSRQWGWSNIFKIGRTSGSPDKWPAPQKDLREACVKCLRWELSQIRNSLVAIVGYHHCGILDDAIPMPFESYTKGLQEHDVWFAWDSERNNLYLHSCHPNFAQQKKFFDRLNDASVDLALTHLKWRP